MARDTPQTKIGSGHAQAMVRIGGNEIRNALYPESNVAQKHAEYGLVGTQTPGEVAEARRMDGMNRDEERGSVLDDRLRQAEASRDGRGREDKSLERE